ncbi:MAG: hypothetical protein M1814_003737 [Vezdaea aestivalis]|nr:MAG: hypothetical protein M1814_003737 [Vezdaea aestivalis]
MPSSSFLLRLGSLLLATCIAPSFQAQQYALKDDYTSNLGTFWDQWNWYSAGDPTHGHVKYLTRDAASAAGLLGTADGAVTFAADSKNVAPGGRPSIRLESKAVYNHGLFIADFSHVPDSACGSWPAYWTFGPNWPHSGEIDIFENVNRATNNLVTLHSGSNCIVNSDGGQTGTLGYNNCDSSSGDTRGCSVADPRGNSFGSGFNAANGGVYAMQWTSASIKVWFFPRGSEPSDINGASPNPSLWGSPVASFQGCDIDSHFKDHQIIFDMTFCGDWAGNVFANDPVLSRASTSVSEASKSINLRKLY